MIEELVIHEIRIDENACRDYSNSRMMSFEVIMPLKLQSTIKALLKDALHCLGWLFVKTNDLCRQRKNGGLEFNERPRTHQIAA